MSTPEERLKRIRVKVERAKKHIRDLEIEIKSFLDSNPYKVGTKFEDESHKIIIHYLLEVSETPLLIAAIAGDILSNLRAALDHLAFNLVDVRGFVDANSVPLTDEEVRDISFPI